MSVIYKPSGKALEYSPLACNLYTGCTHGCEYCYAPAILRRSLSEWSSSCMPRVGILDKLEKEAIKLNKQNCTEEILFCFMSDPYPLNTDTYTTREALRIVSENKLRAQVLTKGGYRACRDFDILKKNSYKFGATLVFSDDKKSKEIEPGAASTSERIEVIKEAHKNGIFTWVSLEPVYDPEDAYEIINKANDYVDFWKVGKINHNKRIELNVDWSGFRSRVTKMLDSLGAKYYIKNDLKKY